MFTTFMKMHNISLSEHRSNIEKARVSVANQRIVKNSKNDIPLWLFFNLVSPQAHETKYYALIEIWLRFSKGKFGKLIVFAFFSPLTVVEIMNLLGCRYRNM
jgi:hypothetical protein